MVDISLKSKRAKLTLGCLICLIVIVAMLSVVKGNFATVSELKEEIAKNENNLLVLDKIYTDANQRKDEVERVLASIPASYEEVSNYAKAVEATAAGVGITAEAQYAKTENKESYGVESIAVKVKASGSYENLLRFIDGISKLPYHIEIDSLTIENKGGVVNLDLTYRVFTSIN